MYASPSPHLKRPCDYIMPPFNTGPYASYYVPGTADSEVWNLRQSQVEKQKKISVSMIGRIIPKKYRQTWHMIWRRFGISSLPRRSTGFGGLRNWFQLTFRGLGQQRRLSGALNEGVHSSGPVAARLRQTDRENSLLAFCCYWNWRTAFLGIEIWPEDS